MNPASLAGTLQPLSYITPDSEFCRPNRCLWVAFRMIPEFLTNLSSQFAPTWRPSIPSPCIGSGSNSSGLAKWCLFLSCQNVWKLTHLFLGKANMAPSTCCTPTNAGPDTCFLGVSLSWCQPSCFLDPKLAGLGVPTQLFPTNATTDLIAKGASDYSPTTFQ